MRYFLKFITFLWLLAISILAAMAIVLLIDNPRIVNRAVELVVVLDSDVTGYGFVTGLQRAIEAWKLFLVCLVPLLTYVLWVFAPRRGR